jgi:hypothetical protein
MHTRRPFITICLSACFALAGLISTSCASAPGGAAERGARCPLSRNSDDMFCATIVRYARDPESGQCCRYDSACAAPVGWKTYTTRDACEEVGRGD